MSNSIGAVISLLSLFLIIFFSFFENKFNRSSRYIFLIMLVVVLCLVVALRGFGLDFENYKSFYYYGVDANLGENIFSMEIEPGFVFLMEIFKRTGLSFEFFYFFIILISCLLTFKSYSFDNKIVNVKMLAIFTLLYFAGYLDVTRAFLASSLLLLSIFYYCKKRYVIVVIFFVFGVFIHYSVMIALPFIFLLNINIKKIIYAVMIFASIILGLTCRFIFFRFYDNLTFYENYRFIHTGLRYIYDKEEILYMNWMHYLSLNGLMLAVPLICIFMIFLNFEKVRNNNSLFLKSIHNMSCYGLLLFSFFSCMGAYIMAVRVFQLFSFGLPVLVYFYCFGLSDKGINYKYISMIMLLMSFFIISFCYLAKVYQPGAMLYYGNIF